MQTRTELHTHLTGMVSFKGLIEVMKFFDYPGFPINDAGELDFKNPVSRTTVISEKIVRGLTIPKGKKVPYNQLDPIYSNRNGLLADIGKCRAQNINEENDWVNKVYSLYFHLALYEAADQGIKYVEISFSNVERIKYMLSHVSPLLLEKIDTRFLLCTNRIRSVKNMEKDKDDIEKGMSENLAIGFDFMGLEENMNDNQNDSNKRKSNSKKSFKAKLDIAIEVLKNYPKSTLRVHAGENENSDKNPLTTLRMIDEIAHEKGIQIPPPAIRLGHAIYFQDCPEYIYLLRKYKVIVEINATSNKTLTNISDFSDIRYKYYLDQGIPIVLSTDGAGMYNTTIYDEDKIAFTYAGINAYKQILDIDNKIIKNKRGN